MSNRQRQPPRPYDRVELAVSGRSTCRLCKSKIPQGDMRVAIQNLFKNKKWIWFYYHTECVETTKEGIEIMKNARFEESNSIAKKRKASNSITPAERLEIEAATVTKKKRMPEDTINARGDLREKLRKIRMIISRHIKMPPYFVFKNKTLDALVEKLPSNTIELLAISGFGPKNTPSLGPILLPIIRDYKRKLLSIDRNSTPSPNTRTISPSPMSVTTLKRSDEDEDEDEEDEVVLESEVSIDEVIRKKIQEAEERGEVIALEV